MMALLFSGCGGYIFSSVLALGWFAVVIFLGSWCV